MNQKEKINEALNRELRRESFENLKLGFLEEYLPQNMRYKECNICETRSMKEESCYVINWRTQGDFTSDDEKQFFKAIEEVAREILKDEYIAYVKVSLAICGYENDDIVKIFKRKSSETEELIRFSLELKQEN